MGKVRIEIHLSEEDAAVLDELAALNSRTRKNFCEMQIRGIISGHRNNPTLPLIPMVVQNLTKSNVEIKPHNQPKSNFVVDNTVFGVAAYMGEIDMANTIKEIENIMKEVDKDKKLNPKEKLRLKIAAEAKGAEIDP